MKKIPKLNVKISIGIIVFVIIVTIVEAVIASVLAIDRVYEESKKQTIRCGKQATLMLNDKLIDQWLINGKDEKYYEVEKSFRSMVDTFDLSYLFVYRPKYNKDSSIDDMVTFIYDIRSDDVSKENTQDLSARSRISEIEMVKEACRTGEQQIITEDFNEKDSRESIDNMYITAVVPIKDASGKVDTVITVDMSFSVMREALRIETICIIVIFIIALIVFVPIFTHFIRKSVVRPVKTLSRHMDEFVTAETGAIDYKPITTVNTGDELEQMANHFNSMANDIVTYTANIEKNAIEKERLKADYDVSEQLRSSVSADITLKPFPERRDFELYASMKNTTYRRYSFCNYFLVNEDELCIVIGESEGNSLPAMIVSMFASTNIQCYAKMGYPPYRIAAETNNQLCSMKNKNNVLTTNCIIASIDLHSGLLTYVNAGMPPVLVKRTGEEYCIENTSIQFNLGKMKGISFDQETIKLTQGSTLIFTSYGVPEMKNKLGDRFTEIGLRDEVNDIAGKFYSLEYMINELDIRLENFRKDAPIELDTTILGFRYFG